MGIICTTGTRTKCIVPYLKVFVGISNLGSLPKGGDRLSLGIHLPNLAPDHRDTNITDGSQNFANAPRRNTNIKNKFNIA